MKTVGHQLSKRDIDWAFYSADPYQAGYIWQAYASIDDIFHDREMWDEHIWPVDDLMRDIEANALPPVTWITPRFQLSDHPPFSTKHAHNWVTDIVNGIMRSEMWDRTAIFITWDEWGGLYDHVAPPKIDGVDLGFRVPMMVISPYAKRGYIDDAFGEFTAPLRFISDNWGLPPLTEPHRVLPQLRARLRLRSHAAAARTVAAREGDEPVLGLAGRLRRLAAHAGTRTPRDPLPLSVVSVRREFLGRHAREFLDQLGGVGGDERRLSLDPGHRGEVGTLELALREGEQVGRHLVQRRAVLGQLVTVDEHVRRLGEVDDPHVVPVVIELAPGSPPRP